MADYSEAINNLLQLTYEDALSAVVNDRNTVLWAMLGDNLVDLDWDEDLAMDEGL